MTTQLMHSKLNTPIGEMEVLATNKGICLLEFYDCNKLDQKIQSIEKHYDLVKTEGTNSHIDQLKKEMGAYFKGELQKFSIPLICHGTDFQRGVWDALVEIPYGVTRTYKEQSLVLGDIKAIRAVASANGKNKIAIVIPCHRVIGSDGSLTGYASGIERKRFLLNLERDVAGPKDLFSQ